MQKSPAKVGMRIGEVAAQAEVNVGGEGAKEFMRAELMRK